MHWDNIMLCVGGYHQCIGGGGVGVFSVGGYHDLCAGTSSVHWECSRTILISSNALMI